MAEDPNREHWDSLGAGYSQNWVSPPQQRLSQKETSFVIQHVPATPGDTVVDVGIGNGRILEKLVSHEQVSAVYGVDLSSEMVEFCRARFADNPKVKALAVCDIAREPLPVPSGVQFLSAVRVLKYIPTWWDVVEKLGEHLAPGGVLVFSMPNALSLKRFARPYAVEYFKTTVQELEQRFDRSDLELLDVTGFSKMPDFLYRSFRHPALAASLLLMERGLDRAVGPARLSRELFVAARRKT